MIDIISIKRKRNIVARVITVLLVMVLSAMAASVSYGYAAADAAGVPIREAHRVKVGDTKYCVFVCDNAALTPSKISGMTDNELTEEILRLSGFCMKQANCRKSKHEALDVDGWVKKGGSFMLSQNDIDRLRSASPSTGSPVKLHMDLLISTDPYIEDTQEQVPAEAQEQKPGEAEEQQPVNEETQAPAEEQEQKPAEAGEQQPAPEETQAQAETQEQKPAETEEQQPATEEAQATAAAEEQQPEVSQPDNKSRSAYSTYKLLSPELLFVVVAAESDASAGEDNCSEGKSADRGIKNGGVAENPTNKEVLPELRTIAMTDRKGPPLEETLKDGTPVTLTWIEPDKHEDSGERSFRHYLPAVLAGLAVTAAAASAVIIRRREKDR